MLSCSFKIVVRHHFKHIIVLRFIFIILLFSKSTLNVKTKGIKQPKHQNNQTSKPLGIQCYNMNNFTIIEKSLVSSSMQLYTSTFYLAALCLPFLVSFALSSAQVCDFRDMNTSVFARHAARNVLGAALYCPKQILFGHMTGVSLHCTQGLPCGRDIFLFFNFFTSIR